jgi:hypothetical protein
MSESQTEPRRGKIVLAALAVLAVLGAGAGAATFYFLRHPSPPPPPPPPTTATAPGEWQLTPELTAHVHAFCGKCHAYPPPDTFARRHWRDEVKRGFDFYAESNPPLDRPPPDIEDVVRYYEARAPEEIVLPDLPASERPLPCRFNPVTYPEPSDSREPSAISNVNLVRLFDAPHKRLDVLACDMKRGSVLALKPYEPKPAWQTLYRRQGKENFNPAHAEVVDLDGDGHKDILVANLGSFPPSNGLQGSVLWLRNTGKGSGAERFQPIPLLKDVGRVADVQAGDFNGDGKLDLIVAVFGWTRTGEILFLENQTTDWTHPKFVPTQIDKRHGAIHVPITDLDGDGNLDFIALISQEHETVEAFLGDGKGTFTAKVLYKAPHPGYGSSGIQLVDLNGDGKVDVLYTNGDVLDKPYFYKPYHRVQWLENKGNLEFEHHHLATMYGVHRAIAADFDGDGDMDVLAASFLPGEEFTDREQKKIDAIILLEQTAPGTFARHSLEKGSADYVSCVAGDVFGNGRPDVVLGRFSFGGLGKPGAYPSLLLWKNEGKKSRSP